MANQPEDSERVQNDQPLMIEAELCQEEEHEPTLSPGLPPEL